MPDEQARVEEVLRQLAIRAVKKWNGEDHPTGKRALAIVTEMKDFETVKSTPHPVIVGTWRNARLQLRLSKRGTVHATLLELHANLLPRLSVSKTGKARATPLANRTLAHLRPKMEIAQELAEELRAASKQAPQASDLYRFQSRSFLLSQHQANQKHQEAWKGLPERYDQSGPYPRRGRMRR